MRRLLPLGVVAVLAACGGSSSKALTHDEFVKQANAICVEYNDRITALGTPQGLSDLVTFARKGQSIAQEDVVKFAKLRPPTRDAKDAAAYVAAGRTVIDDLGRLEAAAKRNDVLAVQRIAAQAQANADQARLLAGRLGLAECVRRTG